MTGGGSPGEIPVWGCVLIGGRSRRMGTPKHLIRQDGLSWLERTVELLAQCTDQVVIAGAGEAPATLDHIPRVADAAGLAGPLAGILGAFRGYPHVSWLVVACDLPDMRIEALRWLLACRGPGVRAILPELAGDGRIEPLLAYYDRRCREMLEAKAATGRWGLHGLRREEGVITPQPPEDLRGSWRNVNTPGDLGLRPGAQPQKSASAR